MGYAPPAVAVEFVKTANGQVGKGGGFMGRP